MTTATKTKTGRNFVEFDQFIDFQVQKTRKSIKATDLLTAGVGILAMFLSYLLVFVVLDHWFVSGGFGIASRWLMLGFLVLLTLAWLSWKIFVPWLLKDVNNLYAAQSIETANSDLKSSLLNLVDFRRSDRELPQGIEKAIEKRAAMSLSKMNVDEAIDRRPLMRLCYVLMVVVILGSLYAAFSPKKISASLWRALVPSADLDVATMIEIEKVYCKLGRKELSPTTEMLARSRPEIHVEIDFEGEPPESVVLYYTTQDQKFRDVPVAMKHLPNDQKHYKAILTGEYGQGLRQNLSYLIRAGDAQSGPYEISVVEPPSATVEKLDYQYPAYMELQPKTMIGGHIDVWEGTEVTVHAVSNQPVRQATLLLLDSENPASEASRTTMKIEDGNRLSIVLKREIEFRTDGTSPHFYRIEVKNKNGDIDPDPIVYGLRIRRDQKPVVKILLPQETDKDIPENTEELSLLAEAHDPDFKLKFLSLKSEIKRGNRPNRDAELKDHVIFEGLKKKVKQSHRWDLKKLNLSKGDTVRFRIEARDNKTAGGGNRGYSRWITLRIVEPVSEEERKDQQQKDRDQAKEQNPEQQQNNDNNQKQKSHPNEKTDPDSKTKSKNNKGKKSKEKSKEQGNGEDKNQESSDTGTQGKQSKQDKDKKKDPNQPQKKDSNQQGDSKGNKKEKKKKQDQQKGPKKNEPGQENSPEKSDDPKNGDQPEKGKQFNKDGSDDDKVFRDLVDKHQKEQEQNPGSDADKKKEDKKDSPQENQSGTSSEDKADPKKAKKGNGQGKTKKNDNEPGKPETKQDSPNNATGKKQEQPKSNRNLKTKKQKATGDEKGPAEPNPDKNAKSTKSKDPKNLNRKKDTNPTTRPQDKKQSEVDPKNVTNNKGNKKPNQSKKIPNKNPSKKSPNRKEDNDLNKGKREKAKQKPNNNSRDPKISPKKNDPSGKQTKEKASKKSSNSGDPKNPKNGSKTDPRKKDNPNSNARKQPNNKDNKGRKAKGQPQQGTKNSPKKDSKQLKNSKLSPGHGTKNQQGSQGDHEAPIDPEKADLEYGKKAANLTLDKLEEQIDRGTIDEKWLKKHGWSKDDLKKFINRNRKKLDGKEFSDEQMTPAKKTQFDEFLKSLKYQKRPGIRQPTKRKADNLKGVGRLGRSTPPEYREATEAFTRSVNSKKSDSKKK